MTLIKIISGAQTGADRAGLDAGLALDLVTGGWIPKGRKTDEGPLSEKLMALYGLREHLSPAYPPRTEQNVKDSDGTLWFGKETSPGGICTVKACAKWGKPFDIAYSPEDVRGFVAKHGIKVLNVAGNRERTNPGIYQRTYDTIIEAFKGQREEE